MPEPPDVDEIRYPLRIRFWYVVRDQAERLWHWVWRAKLAPWHDAHQVPRIPPTYHLIGEREPTDAERARGVTKHKIYRSNG